MIIYRTLNKINGKSYVGMDSKNNPKYLGSGVALNRAIKKYGRENFEKTILESDFSSMEELSKAEMKWIALEKSKNNNGIYNLNEGGLGGGNFGKDFEEIFGLERSVLIKNKISVTNKSKSIRPPSRLGTKSSEKQRNAMSLATLGKSRSEEIKIKIKNSQPHIIKILCVNDGRIFSSINEAAEALQLSLGNVSQVVNGKRKHTKGYTFKRVS